MLGWGIGLAIHALAVFGQFGPFRQNWEDRKVQELLKKERRHTWLAPERLRPECVAEDFIGTIEQVH